jgi:membrane protease YdiL (CAAX protease family)
MSQNLRFAQAALFIATWMALGWIFHLDPYAYLLLGVPLAILFQLFVCRAPLSSVWVRGAKSIRLDWLGVLMALAFMVTPGWMLVLEWPGSTWSIRLYFAAAIVGAVGVAFALRHFTRAAGRSLLFCLATAGLIGCAWMLLAAMAQNHRVTFTLEHAGFAASQFLVLLPVCFVMEEVVFRGVLDSHIQHPQDARPWLSAFVLSAMWGWWHLPITPAPALVVGLIAFPITHAMLGIPFSIFWRRSGNLLVPAIVHALIDAVRNTYL